MACNICKIEKLSEEFCPYNASTECDHPCLICLKCLIDSVTKHEVCPYPECEKVIDKGSERVLLFKQILSQMFPVYEASYTKIDQCESDEEENVIVTGLTGESIRIPFFEAMTIRNLKDNILESLNHPKNKQKLLYNGKDLQNEAHKLSDYGVTSNSKICLVVCLYAIPEKFDHVVFDLYWGLPMKETESLWSKFFGFESKDITVDFLDASCLVFSGPDEFKIIDYRATNSLFGVEHSGDRVDEVKKTGHHTIDVHIREIPDHVTHLFFTLSAWNSPSISKYPNPSLMFFEASKRDKNLCETSFSHAGSSQAVIMCSMSRPSGTWELFESGKISKGNARNYAPLVTTITKLIDSGY